MNALKHSDLWWFCLFYSLTFGGYVGLSSFLPIFLRDQYAVNPVIAGYLTALAAFVGSGVRPLGGYLADKLGGVRMLSFLLIGIGAVYAAGALLPSLNLMVPLVIVGMACLGLGNGAVFQVVPQRFQNEVGVVTGMIGAVGGLGGFLLPILFGNIKQLSNSFAAGFIVLAVLAFGAAILLRVLVAIQQGWRISWRATDEVELSAAEA